MTKQDCCNRITETLGIDRTEVLEGSTISGDFLRAVFDALNTSNSHSVEDSKHSLFDGIMLLLGAEPLSEDFEIQAKSSGGTITTNGIEKVAQLCELWNKLNQNLMNEDAPINTYELSFTVINTLLQKWVVEASIEISDSPAHDFGQLYPELKPHPMLNELEILTPEYLQKSLQTLQANSNEDREGDVESRIGDASEDTPSNSSLSQRISSQLAQPSIDTLIGEINRGVLNLNPPWQRKRVWSESKQRQLIKSVILNLPLPSFILFRLSNSSKREVVDGKQRLSALYDYFTGRIMFPKIKIADDINLGSYSLRDCSEKLFDELPSDAQEHIRGTLIHTSTLSGVTPKTIYEIFTIYNSTGTRLNAVEIRNAAYQDHEVHKKMVTYTGEQTLQADWAPHIEQFRMIIANGNINAGRYKYLAFVERYLGYSRAYNEGGRPGFKKLTTAKSIQAFYESEDPNDSNNADTVVAEFEIEYNFVLSHLNGALYNEGRFHALKATNSLILARHMIPLISGKKIKLDDAIVILDELCQRRLPDNQNSTTIWGYHIASLDALWNKLNTKQRKTLDKERGQYLDKLLPFRNEE